LAEPKSIPPTINKPVIASTINYIYTYCRKEEHFITYKSGRSRSQIDYFMCKKELLELWCSGKNVSILNKKGRPERG